MQRRGVLGERIRSYGWRDAADVTVVSLSQPLGTAPLLQATLWSWKPGAGLVNCSARICMPRPLELVAGRPALALVGLEPDRCSPVMQQQAEAGRRWDRRCRPQPRFHPAVCSALPGTAEKTATSRRPHWFGDRPHDQVVSRGRARADEGYEFIAYLDES